MMLLAMTCAGLTGSAATADLTTRGQDIIDRQTGERVILRGFGLGGWLLPEGYMWGIRKLDRPRQFEEAIVDLIGSAAAAEFWKLYYENFVTEADIAAMKSWGVNSVRVPLLASMLQPRAGQPDAPPFRYSERGFAVLDQLVDWCDRHGVGVIWDMHGAPGGQNAENISDSDGEARLWTEKEKYWPRCIDLWMRVVQRYAERDCVIGYDLLNEPLLKRYEGINPALLREFYVLLTERIRTVDPEGVIFIEGDEWAQDFSMLDPLDWDPHLVIAFHSYPPTATEEGLERWARLRERYNVPLWHGETGERGPPYAVNRLSTEFLARANVGWSWWTHKKFDRMTQPWLCPRSEGFQRILDYWRGAGPRPERDEAQAWLLEQARLTNSARCVFIPEMVRSFKGLDPSARIAAQEAVEPRIVQQPADVGSSRRVPSRSLWGLASGGGLTYAWLRDGQACDAPDSSRLRLGALTLKDDGAAFVLRASNENGTVQSAEARLRVLPFTGPRIPLTPRPPQIDGRVDDLWEASPRLALENIVIKRGSAKESCAAGFRALWDDAGLYLLVEVEDDARCSSDKTGYQNDGVEIFFDCDNSKSDLYGDEDLRFRYVWNAPEVVVLSGRTAAAVRAAQDDTASGLCHGVRGSLGPALGTDSRAGRYVGLDVHVNDNDGRGRILKRSWHARRDDAHLSPSHLGTVRLAARE